jgi:hypothetical protein
MLVFVAEFNQQQIISPTMSLVFTRAVDSLALVPNLTEQGIPKTGITPDGFARHCNLGLRYRIMKKFLLFILGT